MSARAYEQSYDSPAKLNAWLYVDEITHRALNDYTAMLCMLRSATAEVTDPAGLAVLDSVMARLQAAATAFGILRPQRGSRWRSLEDDLERLCKSLTASILADRAIGLTLSSDTVWIRAERSWQISLIVSELVMNAAKHAFQSSATRAIAIKVRLIGRTIQVSVMDNGEAEENFTPGRGSGIVDALAAELGGVIIPHFSRNGSTIVLRVPAEQGAATFTHAARPADTIVQ